MRVKVMAILLSLLISIQATPQLPHPQHDFRANDSGNATLDSLEDSLDALISGSFSNFQNPGDYQVYYGVAGGIAGIGLRMLDIELVNLFNTTVSANISSTVSSLGARLADALIDRAVEINTTHAVWTVSNTSSVVDLGYDFGLSGIADFFAKLASMTGNSTYTDIAEKIFNTIYDLADTTVGISWDTNITMFLENNLWYLPTPSATADMLAPTKWLGVAFGPAGLGTAAAHYSSAPGANTTLASSIIFDVHTYLSATASLSASNVTIPATEDSNLMTNSISLGSSGVGEFYLAAYNATADSSYRDVALNIAEFLLSNRTDGQPNFRTDYYTNGSYNGSNYELGLQHGISGNLEFLTTATMFGLLDENQTAAVDGFRSFISLFALEDETTLAFPERVRNNLLMDYTGSYAYGTAGIAQTLLRSDLVFNTTEHKASIERTRNFLRSKLGTVNGTTMLEYDVAKGFGVGPYVGSMGLFALFTLPGQPTWTVSSTSLDFRTVPLGTTKTQNLVLENVGDGSGNFAISSTVPLFTATPNSGTISSGENTSISVSFKPINETQIDASIVLTFSSGASIPVLVSGRGSDSPLITLHSPENGSTIDEKTTFDFTITDSSLLQSASYAIYQGSQIILQKALVQSIDAHYRVDIDPAFYGNGTYILVVTAVDANFQASTLAVEFTTVVYEETLRDRLFSDAVLYTLIGMTLAGVVAIVVIMRRYR